MKSHADLDNRSQQLNPEHDAYWQSRGYASRPWNWAQLLATEGLKALHGKVVKA
ncbi:MAG: hypothetical protein RI894_664 [Bacteroidota bacterium]|jgi:hypothetical protein